MLYPCNNTSLVRVTGNPPAEQNYTLETGSESEPFTFTHDEFSIVLKGSADDSSFLCGNLTYEAKF